MLTTLFGVRLGSFSWSGGIYARAGILERVDGSSLGVVSFVLTVRSCTSCESVVGECVIHFLLLVVNFALVC